MATLICPTGHQCLQSSLDCTRRGCVRSHGINELYTQGPQLLSEERKQIAKFVVQTPAERARTLETLRNNPNTSGSLLKVLDFLRTT